ncbi:hypothetical protein GCM10008983_22340 [Lentibacillus halophilus]|uniref:Ty3-gypsy retrotransposon protein n=1 Tax=Lentibacillus halophilus TaxID=295065 RepID=A0ABN0ZDT4_9BACI
MTNLRLITKSVERTNKHEFEHAIDYVANQLRLMEQKMAITAENSVKKQYRSNRDDISRSTYQVEDLAKKYKHVQYNPSYPMPASSSTDQNKIRV